MAGPKAKNLWIQMKKDISNRECVECGSNDPTWASVSYGNLFCLECSGIHRSLGVHVSFVRSLGMDKWSDEQLEYMKNGGNAKCKQFFKKHGIPDSMPITDKYYTEVAESYKKKLECLVNGNKWIEPTVGSLSTIPNKPQRKQIGLSNMQTQQNKKYTGMGNYIPPKQTENSNENDWGSLFSTGLTTLSTVASSAVATTSEYAKTAADKIAETSSGLTEQVGQTNWSDTVSTLSTTVKNTSNTGWSTLSSYWQTAKEYTNQTLSGETINNEKIDDNWVELSNNKKDTNKDDDWDKWDDIDNDDEKSNNEEDININDGWEQPNDTDEWKDHKESDDDEWESWT